MTQNKVIALLVVIVIILVGALAFALGRQSSPQAVKSDTADGNAVSVAASLSKPTTASSPKQKNAPIIRNVEIGLDGPDFDACGSSGRPTGLKSEGDNFLAVKASPSLRSDRIDQLGPGDEFYICQTVEQGSWTGIVYTAGGGLAAQCGVSSPVSKRRSYSGPCKTGWVYSKYVELVAG